MPPSSHGTPSTSHDLAQPVRRIVVRVASRHDHHRSGPNTMTAFLAYWAATAVLSFLFARALYRD